MSKLSGLQRKPKTKGSYSLPEFAKKMGVCERTVQRLAKKGEIPGQYRRGKRWRIRESSDWESLGGLINVKENRKRSLFPTQLRELRQAAKRLSTALQSSKVVAVDIWLCRKALQKNRRRFEAWELLDEEAHSPSDPDRATLNKPLFEVVKAGLCLEQDVSGLLRDSPEMLPLLRDILNARLEQQTRGNQRQRSVGLIGLIAKQRGESRSALYRELKKQVPGGVRPLGRIQGILKELEKWAGTGDKFEDNAPPEEQADSYTGEFEGVDECFASQIVR